MTGFVKLSGYVSRFDTPDRSGDVVRAGAFVGAAANIPLLWQHELGRPIGRVLSLVEDAKGLRMVAGVSPDCRDGVDALALVRAGAVDGLSFGYRVKQARRAPGGGREILKVELLECSVVTLPMHGAARITGIEG